MHRGTGRDYWLLTKATRLDDGGTLAVNIIEDVTEAKTAERRERFLSEAGELLVSTLDYEQTLQHVAALVVPTLADWCALDLVDRAAGSSASRSSTPTPTSGGWRRAARPLPARPRTEEGLAAVLRTGDRCSCPRSPRRCWPAARSTREHLRLLGELGMRSAMLVRCRCSSTRSAC